MKVIGILIKIRLTYKRFVSKLDMNCLPKKKSELERDPQQVLMVQRQKLLASVASIWLSIEWQVYIAFNEEHVSKCYDRLRVAVNR